MEPLLGTIILFGGNFAPLGWAFCDGALLPITHNSALFSILGVIYGGDGRTTFALPDLRGRAPVHFGKGPGLDDYRQGQKVGRETTNLTRDQLPSHSHGLNVVTDGSLTSRSRGAMLGAADIYATGGGATVALAQESISETGKSAPVDIRQPVLAMNYIIAIQGTFPSRT